MKRKQYVTTITPAPLTTKQQVEDKAFTILFLAIEDFSQTFWKAEPERDLTEKDARAIFGRALVAYVRGEVDPEISERLNAHEQLTTVTRVPRFKYVTPGPASEIARVRPHHKARNFSPR